MFRCLQQKRFVYLFGTARDVEFLFFFCSRWPELSIRLPIYLHIELSIYSIYLSQGCYHHQLTFFCHWSTLCSLTLSISHSLFLLPSFFLSHTRIFSSHLLSVLFFMIFAKQNRIMFACIACAGVHNAL